MTLATTFLGAFRKLFILSKMRKEDKSFFLDNFSEIDQQFIQMT